MQIAPSAKKFTRMPSAYPAGGWKCEDEEQIQVQRQVVWDIIKQVGQNVMNGQSVINTSLPVKIFEPRSYLERVSDNFCYAPFFLNTAAAEADPVERMKQVVLFVIAGLSNTTKMLKPFNPILGETYQGVYDDGTSFYCEQTSHHPPITNWQMYGPNKIYHLHGYGEWTASFRPNALKGQQKGNSTIEFQDGGKITFFLPEVWCRGLLYGDRIVEYEGRIQFRDSKNRIGCDVEFNPLAKKQSYMSYYLSWGPAPEQPTDYLLGAIFKTTGSDMENEKDRKLICKVEGSWMGCLEFDGKQYWSWELDLPRFNPTPVEKPLPSDSRYREDLQELSKKNYEGAAEWKSKLEQKQRDEEKLRKLGKEGRNPSGKKSSSFYFF